MTNEFTKPSKVFPAIIGQIADPDVYNQNIAAQSKGSIIPIDEDGDYADGNLGDESVGTVGALINFIKLRTGGALKFYNSSGVLISSFLFERPGEIFMYGGSTAPSDGLECNGAEISRTTYAALFGIIGTAFGAGNGTTTFNVPDFRAYVPRGWDHGRGIDSARALGSSQNDDLKAHTHTTTIPAWSIDPGGQGFADGAGGITGNWTYTSSSTGGTETRMKNVAVMFCIRF